MNVKGRIKEVFLIVVIIFIIVPTIFVSSVILLDAFFHPDEVPSFFGWKPFIVLSDSMTPTIRVGDLILVKECDYKAINKKDIIAFQDDHIIITHRVVGIYKEKGNTYFVTKGDNNGASDGFKVPSSKLEGKYIKRYKGLGNVMMFMQSTKGIIICLSIPIMLFFIMDFFSKDEEKKDL